MPELSTSIIKVPLGQLRQSLHKVQLTAGAIDGALADLPQLQAIFLDELPVDIDLSQVVLDYPYLLPFQIVKNPLEEGGLAGSQEAGQYK